MRFEFPEDALEPSHPARVIWNVLGKMNLAAFSKGCGAVEGGAGRSLKNPRMLRTLRLYALSLSLVAQDGTRTRAAATAPSFRTYGSLLQCREQHDLVHSEARLQMPGVAP